MNRITKSVLFGVLWWILITVEVSIIGFIPTFATMGANGFVFNTTGLVLHYALMVAISGLVACLYFKKKTASFSDGIKLGLIVAITGLLLDVLLTAPFFVKSYAFYFGKWTVWFGYALTVLAFGLFSKRK